MDHRWGNRIAVDLPVLVMNPVTAHCGTGRLMNISLDGALISGAPNSHIGARIQVSMGLRSNKTPPASVVDAYLVRKAGATFAIQWAKFAPAEIIALVRDLQSHDSQILPVRKGSPYTSGSSSW